MSDAFTDVAKMKKIKEEIKAHEGQIVEMTLENGRKRQKNKFGRLIEVYPSLFIIEYTNENSLPGDLLCKFIDKDVNFTIISVNIRQGDLLKRNLIYILHITKIEGLRRLLEQS